LALMFFWLAGWVRQPDNNLLGEHLLSSLEQRKLIRMPAAGDPPVRAGIDAIR
jgi:hypothetical protein